MNKLSKDLIEFVSKALIEAGEVDPPRIPDTLEYSDLPLPDIKVIKDCVDKADNNYLEIETYLTVKETNSDGEIIDEYQISPYTEEQNHLNWFDDEGNKRDPIDLLQAIRRKFRLELALNDHNRIKRYEEVLRILGDQHSTKPKDKYMMPFPSPLYDFVPATKRDVIWDNFEDSICEASDPSAELEFNQNPERS